MLNDSPLKSKTITLPKSKGCTSRVASSGHSWVKPVLPAARCRKAKNSQLITLREHVVIFSMRHSPDTCKRLPKKGRDTAGGCGGGVNPNEWIWIRFFDWRFHSLSKGWCGDDDDWRGIFIVVFDGMTGRRVCPRECYWKSVLCTIVKKSWTDGSTNLTGRVHMGNKFKGNSVWKIWNFIKCSIGKSHRAA